ncbi:thiamine pyrophosphate-binding protein [Heliobacterium chlorum]|uniref:Thiamine pyrophosphate-binding protein n=1 Tax=Heliobacterium chlorum TaxID=2698 RepID=A0ABR7SZV9_HELCL|nr:thiamine pyrophosphate-binding protein [Heliobacterium chlorum]MBC9783462.1 thiamine pyrophosphate-binding protein [Heliobacterium chlorum]
METVAQLILKVLSSLGTKRIYGLPGDAILPLMDAISKQDAIRFIGTAHEMGAAFMACGEARVTGLPAVCIATEGPGALNLVNGVADAYRDGIPLLVLTGQVETGKLYSNAKQYIDQQALFLPITGMTTLFTRPESVVDVIKVAWQKAIGDSIPCHISSPKDILLSPAPVAELPTISPLAPPSIDGDISSIVALLEASERPIIIAGKLAYSFKEKVYRLAEQLGAGIIPGQGARGVFSAQDQRVLSGLGEAHIPPILREADCIIFIGSSPYEHPFIPKEVPVIQIEQRLQLVDHSLRPIYAVGDIQSILGKLLERSVGKNPNLEWQEKLQASQKSFLDIIEAEKGDAGRGNSISVRQFFSLLNQMLPQESIIALDIGEFTHWFDRAFLSRGQQVIISEYWRCMGAGLPFGLGAQLACPEKRVFVLTGEGGLLVTLQEMVTAVRYSLPVIVIILNNGQYALEKHKMQKAAMEPFGVDVYSPDFAGIASACGALGLRVKRPEELRSTLERAFQSNRFTVVDILVDESVPMFL